MKTEFDFKIISPSRGLFLATQHLHHPYMNEPVYYNCRFEPFITTLRLEAYGPPGVLGRWREGLFIFKDLGSTGNYFSGAGEQVHSFRD